eukprot:352225-Chlamydomonas_euryale.AAC.4
MSGAVIPLSDQSARLQLPHQSGHARVRSGHARVRSGHARVRSGHATVRSGHARVRVRVEIYRKQTHEGFASVERSKAEGIKQRAGGCHKGHASAHGLELGHAVGTLSRVRLLSRGAVLPELCRLPSSDCGTPQPNFSTRLPQSGVPSFLNTQPHSMLTPLL